MLRKAAHWLTARSKGLELEGSGRGRDGTRGVEAAEEVVGEDGGGHVDGGGRVAAGPAGEDEGRLAAAAVSEEITYTAFGP